MDQSGSGNVLMVKSGDILVIALVTVKGSIDIDCEYLRNHNDSYSSLTNTND